MKKLKLKEDEDGNKINLRDLLGNTYISFDCNNVGIYIPEKDIIRRTAYQWFARLSEKQVLESDTILGKHLLISQS